MLCRLFFTAAAGEKSGPALKELFQLHDYLEYQIDLTSMKAEGGIHPKHRLMFYHDFFTSRITPGEDILDIGCGYGAVANSLAKYGANVTALDYDADQIEKAREHFQRPNLEFIVGVAPEAVPNRKFDGVILSGILEHFEHRVELLKNICSLQPKKIFIRVPMINRHWHVALRRELGMSYFSDPTHHTEYSLESFEEEMSSAGLEIKETVVIWGELWAEVTPCLE